MTGFRYPHADDRYLPATEPPVKLRGLIAGVFSWIGGANFILVNVLCGLQYLGLPRDYGLALDTEKLT